MRHPEHIYTECLIQNQLGVTLAGSLLLERFNYKKLRLLQRLNHLNIVNYTYLYVQDERFHQNVRTRYVVEKMRTEHVEKYPF